ncbi:MAG TPA: HigA family addiction module antitoxin [Magnetospirillum sp.]|nr:HigA family addiction module antitoxin [Magnetospirillum sp.]
MSKFATTIERVRTHPGEMLHEEFMVPLGLSGNQLAHALKVPANRINDIVAGRRAVTADTALRLSRYFGTTAEFWLNLQQAHDLSKVVVESLAAIEHDIQPRRVA